MQIETNISVTVPKVTCFRDLMNCANAVTEIEGGSQAHAALKMNVAAGDLAACLTERKGKQIAAEVYDEVAALVLRGVAVGLAFGMTPNDLMEALTREGQRLAEKGVSERVTDAMKNVGPFVQQPCCGR